MSPFRCPFGAQNGSTSVKNMILEEIAWFLYAMFRIGMGKLRPVLNLIPSPLNKLRKEALL